MNKRPLNVEESLYVVFDEKILTDKTTDPVGITNCLTELNLEDESEVEIHINENAFQTPELEIVNLPVGQEEVSVDHFADKQRTDVNQTEVTQLMLNKLERLKLIQFSRTFK